MRILGIDPGTAIVGYSIIEFDKGKYNVLDYGCIYTDKDEDMPVRLEKIYDSLDNLIKLWKPTDMAIEDLFFFKKQIQEMVKIILKLDEIPKPDDAADALAIAITHINSKNSFGGFTRGDNISKKLEKLNSNKIKLEDYKKLIR